MPTRMIAEYLVALGAKASVLFIGAALITMCMRNRAAAWRHLTWLGAIVGAALLPVLGALAPSWSVRVLSTPAATAPSLARARNDDRRAAAALIAVPRNASDVTTSALAPQGRVAAAAPDPSVAVRRRWRNDDGLLALVVLWFMGSVWFLVRIVLSVLSLTRLQRRATPVTELAWLKLIRTLMPNGRRVSLFVSDEIDVPFTWGMFRPVILLPREVDEWSEARCAMVLRHELEHVDRGDVLTQLLARIVRALHWPNPLAWLADRQLRRECELACDDGVVAAGVRPTRYAEELLTIASALAPRGLGPLAPGFVSRPSLEVRLRALLAPWSIRRRATRLDAMFTAIGVLALAGPLAAMRPAERSLPGARAHSTVGPAISVARAVVSRLAPRGVPLVAQRAAVAVAPLGSAAVGQLCSGDGGLHSNSTQDREGTKTWEVHWSGRDCAVDLRAEGDIRFNDDLTDIVSISRNGYFDLSVRNGDELTRLVVKPAGQGDLNRRYTVNGTERPWNSTAQQWFADVLLQLDRRTGFAIDVRFPKLLAQGVPAVLNEIQKLEGDYVRGLYFTRLIERAPLSPREVRETLALAGRDVGSDYELARILVAISERYGLPDEDTRAVFLNAVNKLSSDYERSRTLHALLSRADLSPREASAVLQSASALKSDYELSRTLVDMTDKKLISPSLRSLYLDDLGKLSSDYERSRATLALLGSGKLANSEVGEVIALANGIKSDYERARVLVAVGDAYDLEGQARDAYLKAAQSISSEYERGRVLAALRSR